MIHCKGCGRLTEGMDGFCAFCIAGLAGPPASDLKRWELSVLARRDAELEMSWVQWQADERARLAAEEQKGRAGA